MTGILIGAFASGMVSTVNPCGFAMLPAYLGFFLGDRTDRSSARIGTVAASVAAGFLAVFTVAGVLIGAGLRAIVGAIPWLALVVGIGLVVVGVTQLFGTRLIPYLRGPSRVRKSGTPGGMFVFGVSYALASLSCTLPIFLTLVTGAVAAGSFGQAVGTFVSYGAGMAVVVVGLTVAVAAGRRSIVDKVRPLAARLDRISGWIMTVAGVFIVWYWYTVLSAGAIGLNDNPIVRLFETWSSSITRFVVDRPLIVAAILMTLVAGLWAKADRRSEVADARSDSGDPATRVQRRRDGNG